MLYEVERNDTYSQIIVGVLLLGIYGLIYVNETHRVHFYFAFVVFIAILAFMTRHCYLTRRNALLMSSLCLETLTLLYIVTHIHDNIFYGEILYIANFALFYLYLHLIT